MRVHDNTIVHLEARRRRKFGIWNDPDARDYEVRRSRVAAIRSHRIDPRIALDRLERSRQHEVHATRRVFSLVKVRDDRRHDTIHHPVCHFQHADVVSELPGHGSDLEAYIAGTDNDHIPGGVQVAANAQDVVDAAQIVQTFHIAAGHLNMPGARACSENQRVVGYMLIRRGGHILLLAINGRDPCFEANVDVGRCVEFLRFEVEAFCRKLSGQEFL